METRKLDVVTPFSEDCRKGSVADEADGADPKSFS